MRLFSFLFLFFASCLCSVSQNVERLPVDPRIKVGKMANGLTYYIVNNDVLDGYADFYLLQKIGSAIEKEGEEGMTSFIGNMSLRGTRNFPGNTILDYIEGVGMNPEKDLKITAGMDETIFCLSNVPVKRGKDIFDSTLLILYNWACSINFDEEDMEKEKVFFKNRYVTDMVWQKRATESFKSTFWEGTGYSSAPPVALLDAFGKYSTKNLRKFYYQWYRPDLEALIVVGDVDATDVENRIKTLFQAAPKSLKPSPRIYEGLPSGEGVEVALYSEKEITTANLAIYLRSDLLPQNLRTSAVPFVLDYMNYIMKYLVQDRISVRFLKEDVPILSQSVAFEKFLGNDRKEALKVEVETSADSVERVLSILVQEIKKVKDLGFDNEEFASASERFYRELAYRYDWRGLIQSEDYAKRCIDNYLNGFSLASIELHKEYMDKVKRNVDTEHINTYTKSFIKLDNCAITCSYPFRGDSLALSKERLAEIVMQSGYEMELDETEADYLPEVVNKEITPGTIVSENKEPITKSSLLQLSNGATVVIKPTQAEPQTIHFKAVSKGGLSLMNGISPALIRHIDQIASLSLVGGLKLEELERVKKRNGIALDKHITLSLNQLDGKVGTSDFELFLKMVYNHFSDIEGDTVAFRKFKERVYAQLEYSLRSPENVFADSLRKIKYGANNMARLSKKEMMDGLDYGKIVSFLKGSFSNAANYTFIIVGDIEEDKIKELVSKYIASLPGNPNRRDTWRVIPFYLNKISKTSHFATEMDFPRNFYNLSMIGSVRYDLENVVISELVQKIIKKEITQKMNELGIPVSFDFSLRQYPEEFLVTDISFVTHKYSPSILDTLSSELKRIAAQGVNKRELNRIRSINKAQFVFREQSDNDFWVDIITNRFVYGKDFYTKYVHYVDNTTLKTVNDALKEYIEKGSILKLSMSEK